MAVAAIDRLVQSCSYHSINRGKFIAENSNERREKKRCNCQIVDAFIGEAKLFFEIDKLPDTDFFGSMQNAFYRKTAVSVALDKLSPLLFSAFPYSTYLILLMR